MGRQWCQRSRVGELEKQAVLRLSSVFSLCLSFHCEWWINTPQLEKWGYVGEACGEVFQVMGTRPSRLGSGHSCSHGSQLEHFLKPKGIGYGYGSRKFRRWISGGAKSVPSFRGLLWCSQHSILNGTPALLYYLSAETGGGDSTGRCTVGTGFSSLSRVKTGWTAFITCMEIPDHLDVPEMPFFQFLSWM